MSDHQHDMADDYSPEGLEKIHPYAKPFLFLGKENVKRNFIWLPAAGLIIVSIMGFFFPPKHPAPWDFGFSYSVIGFVSCAIVMLSAKSLFKHLARPEDYYGEGDAPKLLKKGDHYE